MSGIYDISPIIVTRAAWSALVLGLLLLTSSESSILITSLFFKIWVAPRCLRMFDSASHLQRICLVFPFSTELAVRVIEPSGLISAVFYFSIICNQVHWSLNRPSPQSQQYCSAPAEIFFADRGFGVSTTLCFDPCFVIVFLHPQLKVFRDLCVWYFHSWFELQRWLPRSQYCKVFCYLVAPKSKVSGNLEQLNQPHGCSACYDILGSDLSSLSCSTKLQELLGCQSMPNFPTTSLSHSKLSSGFISNCGIMLCQIANKCCSVSFQYQRELLE